MLLLEPLGNQLDTPPSPQSEEIWEFIFLNQLLVKVCSCLSNLGNFNCRTAQYVNCAAANPGADAGMYDASEQYKLSTVFFLCDWLIDNIYRSFAILRIKSSMTIYFWKSFCLAASCFPLLFGNENRGHVNKPPYCDQESKCYMLFPIQDIRLLAGIWSKRQGDNHSGRSYETWGDASFWAAYFMIVKTFEEPKSSRISIHLCIFCEAWQHISEGRITQRGTHGSRGLSQGEHQAEQGQTSSRTRPNIQRI